MTCHEDLARSRPWSALAWRRGVCSSISALLCMAFVFMPSTISYADDNEKPATTSIEALRKQWQAFRDKSRLEASKKLLELARRLDQAGKHEEARLRYQEWRIFFPENHAAGSFKDYKEGAAARRKIQSQQARRLLKTAKTIRVTGVLDTGANAKQQDTDKPQRTTFVRSLNLSPLMLREDSIELGITKVWNGSQAWLQRGERVQLLAGPNLDNSANWAERCVDFIFGASLTDYAFVKSLKVMGKPAWRFQSQENSQILIDFAQDSGRPIRIIGDDFGIGAFSNQSSAYFSKWTTVEACEFPGKIDFFDGSKKVLSIDEIVYGLNVKLAPELFQLAQNKSK